MVTFSFLWALIISVIACATSATPLASSEPSEASSQLANISRVLVPAPPVWLIYSDQDNKFNGPPPPSEIKGFTVFAISFLLGSGPADQARRWERLSKAQRDKIVSQYHNAGISLIVSAFGATEQPTTSLANPAKTADFMAKWVKDHALDGIDVDYEDFAAFDRGTAEEWLIIFTRRLRAQLPRERFILTHAPIAPWFSTRNLKGGGYLTIHRAVGQLIDWYNVQFYNQGPNEYTSCSGLLDKSSRAFPDTALFQIIAKGVPQSKLVIGKPGKPVDQDDGGFMQPIKLATCLREAKNRGWKAGAMTFEFPNADSAWIRTVRSLTFPV